MIYSSIIPAVVAIVLGFPFGTAAMFAAKPSSAPKEGGKDSEIKSNTVSDIYMTVGVKPVVLAGGEIPIKITLVNDGKEEAAYEFETLDPFEVTLTITTKDGKKVPLTRFGKRYLKFEDDDGAALPRDGSTRTLFISPKERDDLSVKNLALYYDLTLPGDYVLNVSYTIIIGDYFGKNKKAELKVAPVSFRVEKP